MRLFFFEPPVSQDDRQPPLTSPFPHFISTRRTCQRSCVGSIAGDFRQLASTTLSFGSGRNDVEIVKPIRIARPTRQISKSVCTTSFDATEHLGSDRLKTITSTASSRGRRWPRDQLRSRHASKRTAFMANPSPVPVLHPAIERLKDAIAQQEKTVEELRAAGHLYTDAERYLLQLKDRLKHL